MNLCSAMMFFSLLTSGCSGGESGQSIGGNQSGPGGASPTGGGAGIGVGGAGISGSTGVAGAVAIGGGAGTTGSAGVGGAAGATAGQGGGAAMAGMASIEVGGTAIDHHVIPDKTIDVPHDLSKWKIDATVFDASPSGATVYGGKGHADGTWTVPGVPSGPYILHADDGGMYDRYFATSERLIDLGQSLVGRPDAAKATLVDSTVLQLDLTLAPSMAAFDSIELFSPRSGAYGARGDTTPGSAWSHTLNIHDALLLGDDAWIVQSDGLSTGSPDFHVLIGGFVVDPFTMIDGQTTTLTGSISPAPKTTVLPTLQQGAFIAATGNKGGVFPYLYEEINAVPGDLAVGGGLAPALYRNEVDGATKDTPLALSFGNPFPASWTVTATFSVGVSIDVKTPMGTVLGYFVRAGVDRSPVANLMGTIGPQLGGPGNSTIDGQPGSYVAGGSLTPMVAWESPSLGTASYFLVAISDRAKVTPSRTVQVITTATSTRIPPGVVMAGHEYNVVVTAYSQAAGVGTRPFAVSYPRHFAETFIALLAP